MPRFLASLRALSPAPPRLRREATRRASIAALFRIHPTSGEEQVLIIRRAVNPKDPWSGNVALPGGRQDAADNGDDEKTAIRETLEEIGLDISGSDWERLGRLVDDRVIDGFGKKMAIAMHGFAARSSTAGEQLKLQPSEVADAWWVDTSIIAAENLEWRVVSIGGMVRGLRDRPLARSLLRWLGCETINFASIALPPPLGAVVGAGADPKPLPPGHPRRENYELWGLTLCATALQQPSSRLPLIESTLVCAHRAFFSDLLRTSAAGQPLVGKGAPPTFRGAFTATSQSFTAQAAFRVLEFGRVYGAKATAAATVAVVATVVGGVVVVVRS